MAATSPDLYHTPTDIRPIDRMPHTDPALTALLDGLAPPGIDVAHRVVAAGDDAALLPAERPHFAGAVDEVRRRSGAARLAARELLARFGHGGFALPRSRHAGPRWPPGLVGSLAHDDEVAVAAVAPTHRIASLGIDVEPPVPLPDGLLAVVATPAEQARIPRSLLETRLLFAAKEAVFKALNPRDGLFLDFGDIEVDLDAASAVTTTGQRVALAFVTAPRIVVLAYQTAVTPPPIRGPG